MKTRNIITLILVSVMIICTVGCQKADEPAAVPDNAVANDTGVPEAYLEPMEKLLSEWGVRKGSMSDPLIGTRILMYEKTKDEVGFMLIDLDGDGTEELITAPFDSFGSNAMVYDILTVKDGQAFHLANSLQATYHLMADNSFILRTPAEDGSYTFKRVTVNGTERPTEVEITKEESAKYYISTAELTPFSSLGK